MNPPPLLVTFDGGSVSDGLHRLLHALPEDSRIAHEPEIRHLVERVLPPVVSVRGLAVLFGVSPRLIAAMLRKPERYYRVFEIRTGKKVREIQAPRVALKVFQKWFGYHLAQAVDPGPGVCGFVPGQSTVRGAAVHCQARWVYSVDIRDFFRSTPTLRVREALVALGYPTIGAEMIARLSSYGGGLAQGSPASPVLSNVAFSKADEELRALAVRTSTTYSRYADDLVFSGKGDVPADLAAEIQAIVQAHGWVLAPEKERLAVQPARMKVFGLLVNGATPRLTKGYRNRLRGYRHLLLKGALAEQDLRRVNGHLAYAHGVDESVALLTQRR